jgi:hypothetical protein
LNPFRNNPEINPVIYKSYRKFFDDNILRYLILGIDTRRFGAGVAGIEFTDSERPTEKICYTFLFFAYENRTTIFQFVLLSRDLLLKFIRFIFYF